jgi:hypothetical protein
MEPDQVGGGSRLVDEDQAAAGKAMLDAPPSNPCRRDVRSFLLGCEYAFF